MTGADLPADLALRGFPRPHLVVVGPLPPQAPAPHALAHRVEEASFASLTHRADGAISALATSLDPGAADLADRLATLQRVLAPGGDLLAWPVRPDRGAWRALHEAVLHYFDPALAPGEPLVLPYRVSGRPRTRTGVHVRRRGREAMASHFDELAPTYWQELPRHIQDHFFAQKIAPLERLLADEPGARFGLDVGCGLGQYARHLGRRFGARVVGVDASQGILASAHAEPAEAPGQAYAAADSRVLPFADASFDFAYVVNVLHHLKRGDQERALHEIRRVLRPGGVLLVQEMNQRNPLFAWYLRHVYPKTRRIDRGDEEYVHPDRLPLVDGFAVERVDHFTFTPDFAPSWAFPTVRRVERRLERGPLGPYAIHYAARLRRN